ncbi:MAG: hypothetical protein ACOC3C_06600 [Candidatus Thorarchaeota archaeon]
MYPRTLGKPGAVLLILSVLLVPSIANTVLSENPEEIATFPVVGATSGLFAMLQVMETLKLIIGFGETLEGRVLLFDGERMDYMSTEVKHRNDCPVCSHLWE